MITAGVDVGAATAKTVILVDGRAVAHAIIPTGHSVRTAADRVTEEALRRAGVFKVSEWTGLRGFHRVRSPRTLLRQQVGNGDNVSRERRPFHDTRDTDDR